MTCLIFKYTGWLPWPINTVASSHFHWISQFTNSLRLALWIHELIKYFTVNTFRKTEYWKHCVDTNVIIYERQLSAIYTPYWRTLRPLPPQLHCFKYASRRLRSQSVSKVPWHLFEYLKKELQSRRNFVRRCFDVLFATSIAPRRPVWWGLI